MKSCRVEEQYPDDNSRPLETSRPRLHFKSLAPVSRPQFSIREYRRIKLAMEDTLFADEGFYSICAARKVKFASGVGRILPLLQNVY